MEDPLASDDNDRSVLRIPHRLTWISTSYLLTPIM